MSDNAVYSLCKDKEGGIWAGTYFGGVNYYPHQYTSFQKFFPDNTLSTLSGNAVREICEDQYGHLWIGTEDGD
ncbi:two-component regulator propeller domain-containing protein [Paraflavitalea speifideaquila]|uniref:two-component regulator propeller domain-containing protein n=1 Tax=Paraflavitalea speifideaquila TaxID=3076558 RepID=UPI003312FDE2